MTINDVIALVERQCPGGMERAEQVRQISLLEKRIINEVLSHYPEAVYDKKFHSYHPDTDGSDVLLVPEPYSQLYVHYILAQHYLMMLEQKHYNNQLYIFNGIYDDYKVHCIQTMRPDATYSKYRTR